MTKRSLELFETHRRKFREVELHCLGTQQCDFYKKNGIGSDFSFPDHLRKEGPRWYFEPVHLGQQQPIHCCVNKKPYLDLETAKIDSAFEVRITADAPIWAQMEKMRRVFEEKFLEVLFAGRRFFMDPAPIQNVSSIWQYTGNFVHFTVEGGSIPGLNLDSVMLASDQGQSWEAFIPPGPEREEIKAALAQEVSPHVPHTRYYEREIDYSDHETA